MRTGGKRSVLLTIIKNGEPVVVSEKDKRHALNLLGELSQAMEKLGLYEAYCDYLEEMTADVEALESSGTNTSPNSSRKLERIPR